MTDRLGQFPAETVIPTGEAATSAHEVLEAYAQQRRRALMPEEELMLAVLASAIDYVRTQPAKIAASRGAKVNRLRRHRRDWHEIKRICGFRYVTGGQSAHRGYRRARANLQREHAWFRSDDDSYIFSFAHICTHFGWDVESVRRRVFGACRRRRQKMVFRQCA